MFVTPRSWAPANGRDRAPVESDGENDEERGGPSASRFGVVAAGRCAEKEVDLQAAANDLEAGCPGGTVTWCLGASVLNHRSGGAAFMEDGSEAPRRGGVSTRRQGAKPTGGAK